MDSLRNPPSTGSRGDDPESQSDLSALSWVQDELRRSLELAHKALRRHLKESETTFDSDVDAADPAVIHGARQHIHQGVGALELVGLPAGANLLRACEAAVQRCIAKPRMLDIHAVATICGRVTGSGNRCLMMNWRCRALQMQPPARPSKARCCRSCAIQRRPLPAA